MVEISNQQAFLDKPHMPLTPRIEFTNGKTYTSLSDFEAVLTTKSSATEIAFDARGRLLTAAHQSPPNGDLHYHLAYRLNESTVEITASTGSAETALAPLRFILPVIARSDEAVEQLDAKTVRIHRQKGTITVRTDAPQGFETIPSERTFNLVPGFECVPLIITMQPGTPIRLQLEAILKT
jgi:hypothetical protein